MSAVTRLAASFPSRSAKRQGKSASGLSEAPSSLMRAQLIIQLDDIKPTGPKNVVEQGDTRIFRCAETAREAERCLIQLPQRSDFTIISRRRSMSSVLGVDMRPGSIAI